MLNNLARTFQGKTTHPPQSSSVKTETATAKAANHPPKGWTYAPTTLENREAQTNENKVWNMNRELNKQEIDVLNTIIKEYNSVSTSYDKFLEKLDTLPDNQYIKEILNYHRQCSIIAEKLVSNGFVSEFNETNNTITVNIHADNLFKEFYPLLSDLATILRENGIASQMES